MRLSSLLFAVLLAAAFPAYAQPVETAPEPVAPSVGDALTSIETPAKFALMMDFETGNVLFSKNGDDLMKPASMAKLMTIAILFEKLKHGELRLDDTFQVSEGAWRQSIAEKSAASKMFVHVGDAIRVEDLIRGIIIQSGNDACIVVAEHFAGSEAAFAKLMNAEAQRIGLSSSTFANSNGMPDPAQNVTAHDLAKLARHIIKEYPDYFHYFGEREFTWSKIKQPNRNHLLGTYAGADGMKTGHTEESGYGMVATAVQDGRRLILVENGLTSEAERAAEAKRLLDIGFREFKTYALLKAGDVVGEATVWAGDVRAVPLSVRQPVNIMMRRASRDGLKVTLHYEEPVVPPIARGQQLGHLTVTAPGVPDMTVPVFAGDAIEEGGLFTQMKVGLKALMADEPEKAEQAVELKMQDDGAPPAPASEPAPVPTQ